MTGAHSCHFSPALVGVNMHATWLGTRMSCDSRQVRDLKNDCLTTIEILQFYPLLSYLNLRGLKLIEVDKISKAIVMNYTYSCL